MARADVDFRLPRDVLLGSEKSLVPAHNLTHRGMESAKQVVFKREWMGIEPTRRRANDASTALKAAGPTRRPDTPRFEQSIKM